MHRHNRLPLSDDFVGITTLSDDVDALLEGVETLSGDGVDLYVVFVVFVVCVVFDVGGSVRVFGVGCWDGFYVYEGEIVEEDDGTFLDTKADEERGSVLRFCGGESNLFPIRRER